MASYTSPSLTLLVLFIASLINGLWQQNLCLSCSLHYHQFLAWHITYSLIYKEMPCPRSLLALVKEITWEKKKKDSHEGGAWNLGGKEKIYLKTQQQLDVRGYKNTLFDKVSLNFIVRWNILFQSHKHKENLENSLCIYKTVRELEHYWTLQNNKW